MPTDITVQLDQGSITINGKHEERIEEGKEGDKVWRSERRMHNFTRSFALPENANQEAITAKLVSLIALCDHTVLAS